MPIGERQREIEMEGCKGFEAQLIGYLISEMDVRLLNAFSSDAFLGGILMQENEKKKKRCKETTLKATIERMRTRPG